MADYQNVTVPSHLFTTVLKQLDSVTSTAEKVFLQLLSTLRMVSQRGSLEPWAATVVCGLLLLNLLLLGRCVWSSCKMAVINLTFSTNGCPQPRVDDVHSIKIPPSVERARRRKRAAFNVPEKKTVENQRDEMDDGGGSTSQPVDASTFCCFSDADDSDDESNATYSVPRTLSESLTNLFSHNPNGKRQKAQVVDSVRGVSWTLHQHQTRQLPGDASQTDRQRAVVVPPDDGKNVSSDEDGMKDEFSDVDQRSEDDVVREREGQRTQEREKREESTPAQHPGTSRPRQKPSFRISLHQVPPPQPIPLSESSVHYNQ